MPCGLVVWECSILRMTKRPKKIMYWLPGHHSQKIVSLSLDNNSLYLLRFFLLTSAFAYIISIILNW